MTKKKKGKRKKTKTLVSIRNLSNRELLREVEQMKSGRYINPTVSGKRWSSHLQDEIKRRKNLGKMKESAGRRRRRASLFPF